MILDAVNAMSGEFALNQVESVCPGVSRDMIRRVLRGLQKTGHVESLGSGPGAAWRKRGHTPKRVTERVIGRIAVGRASPA